MAYGRNLCTHASCIASSSPEEENRLLLIIIDSLARCAISKVAFSGKIADSSEHRMSGPDAHQRAVLGVSWKVTAITYRADVDICNQRV